MTQCSVADSPSSWKVLEIPSSWKQEHLQQNCKLQGYGLSNAPRTPRVWYGHVDKTVKAANFKQHSFDRCFYYHLNQNTCCVDCLLICHVDDFMATYSGMFGLGKLESLFSWGSTTKITPETQGEYRGKEIIIIYENGKYKYKVSQKTFCDNLRSRSDSLQTRPRSSEAWLAACSGSEDRAAQSYVLSHH